MNTSISFLVPLQEDILAVEALMRSQADGYHPDLRAALDLILASGGKRIRTSLTLLIGRMLGAPEDKLLTLAAAIELLHTATLVHDDLIDNSLLRRGTPTLNSQWSPGATVLTGDFLFARAAKLAADTDSIRVMHLFARMLTVVVNGEINQLFNSRCKASHRDYLERIYAKTASLFETSAQSAALITPASEDIVDQLRNYGYQIGMAFQIVDDILDFTSNQTSLGKPVGSDLRQGLITLPTLNYMEKHPDDPLIQEILAGRCLKYDEQIVQMVDSIRTSGAIDQSYQEAETYIEHALISLRRISPSPERQALEELAAYIVSRKL